jgi:hypothetical protein
VESALDEFEYTPKVLVEVLLPGSRMEQKSYLRWRVGFEDKMRKQILCTSLALISGMGAAANALDRNDLAALQETVHSICAHPVHFR